MTRHDTFGAMPRHSSRRSPKAGRVAARSGFTLIETMVAVMLLTTVVLAMAMSTTLFSKKISDSSGRSRAQAMSDLQIARARAWPTYSTISDLAGATYNAPLGGLTPATQVVLDTTGGKSVTRVKVTITGNPTSGLRVPLIRNITVAAP